MPDALRRARPSAFVLALLLAAPAAAQTPARNPDPYERWNRKSYNLSQQIYDKALRPAAMVWKRVVPEGVREALRNGLSNLGEPVIFFNDVLQGRADDASTTLKRFVINSSVGFGGVADVAKAWGVPHHDNDFGTTLGRYGAGPGPYIYIPVLGPTDGRDLFGRGVDTALNPRTWIDYSARTATGVADTVAGGLNVAADSDSQLQTIRSTATDPYATLRSLYLQNRQAQIRGEAVDVNALPDFDDPSGRTAPAAPGSISPDGAPPLKRPDPSAPQGDAAALPQASSPPTTPTSPPRD